jgi:hypothetical protein
LEYLFPIFPITAVIFSALASYVALPSASMESNVGDHHHRATARLTGLDVDLEPWNRTITHDVA